MSDTNPITPQPKSPTSGFGNPNPPATGPSTPPDAAQPDYFRPEDVDVKTLPQEPDKTIVPDRIQFSIRLRFDPIRNLTPEKLGQYLDSFRLGFFRNAALTWDAMERRDDRLQTVAPKRKKSIARHGWEVLAVDDSPEAQAQKEFLQNFYDHITVMTALEPDEEGGFGLLIRQMMDAVGKRYAVHEIVWQPQPDGNLTAKMIFCPLWWFEGTRGKLRFLLNEFAIYGVEMEEGGWMVTVGDGLMEACSVAYMFKHLPLRDWLAFSERFGMPGVLGKTDSSINSNEWQAMVEVVQNFANDWGAVTNLTNSIELVESKNTGEQPFQPLVERMDEAVTRMWRGADLGTSSKHDANGASLQADETAILEVDDAVLISETLTRKLSKYALQWKFGDAPQLAFIRIKVSEEDTTDMDMKVDGFLLQAGFPISVDDAAQRYNRPIPTDGETLLKAVAQPQQNQPTKGRDDDGDANIANEGPGPEHSFEEHFAQKLSSAVSPDLNLVNKRISELMSISDPELLRNRAAQLLRWIDANADHFASNPDLVEALHQGMAAAFGNGLAANTKTS